MLGKFFEVNGDSDIYGTLATNLLTHGRYALTDGDGVLHSTLIRLPGYPLFLAACFRIFGIRNFVAVGYLQIVLELVGCTLLACVAWSIASPQYRLRAAQATLWLAVLCPFTAIYAVEPLTEASTLFCIALALWAVVRFCQSPAWHFALVFTASVSFTALLRPDGALVAIALAPPILLAVVRARGTAEFRTRMRMAIACFLLAAGPFAIWTGRNWRVFQVVQPLAPRYATDPGEYTWPGFQMWTKTWCLDFVSTYQVYWNVPDDVLDITKLPARAFDSPQQYEKTAQLFADYKANGNELPPALDQRFLQLAKERIAAHPMRYYVVLPVGRMLDMWLRPRVENLPIDLDWWVYSHHNAETRFTWFYIALNVFYLLLGIVGLCLRPRFWQWMLLYFVLRSALLCTIEAPEARYTIECFPMLFVLGGIALAHLSGRSSADATSRCQAIRMA